MQPDNVKRNLRDFNRSSDLSICEPFQENVFEAGNSTYALKGLLYLDTTCHFSRWKETQLLGKYKTKYVLSRFSLICICTYILYPF